jgi:predicted ATPase/DNA-binding winged helix-turn-helix (wHTH) protein
MPEITEQEDVPLPLNGGAALAANVHRSSGAERLAEPTDSLVRPVTKRWTEQRWMLDNIIQANGVDWDQPRTHCWNAACGLQAAPDFARIRRRVHKYADIAPKFADMARIREERARLAQAAGELVTARECYFMAAIRWGAAQWPIDQADDLNRQNNNNKRDCFTRYSRLADHHVEPVWVARCPTWTADLGHSRSGFDLFSRIGDRGSFHSPRYLAGPARQRPGDCRSVRTRPRPRPRAHLTRTGLVAGRCHMARHDVISFGPYRLIPAERVLSKGDTPVTIGSRALDILIALVEEAGEVISQRDLMACAWPNLVVGEGSLRVTIAGLRKTLGDGQDNARFIANVTGRGYCFVHPVERAQAGQEAPAVAPLPAAAPTGTSHRLPARLANMVGREDAIEALSSLLASRRFVSVVGPGGMGKTTVAISVAHALLDDFGDAIYFVDLGVVSNASLVSSAVAAVLGVMVQAQDPLPSLLAFLAGHRILLILDNCEHVIDAAAALTERLYSNAPQVHLLTTSRESLRAEGEHVHLLVPLHCPEDKPDLTATEAMTSPAVQLFMERASASGYTSGLTDADAPAVASICRRLDGIALAIELAGSRVGAHGLQGTADLLNNRFKLLWEGRRTALPRHQTLRAMLDWSFTLLSEQDRRVLIRLSVFVGVFTLAAAEAVACDDKRDDLEVGHAIGSLIDKSLLWVASIDGTAHYRLLDTTRAYAAGKLAQTDDARAVARRHAAYYAGRLGGLDRTATTSPGRGAAFAPYMGNIRAALEWSFSSEGEPAIGVRLAAGAAPLFLGLSLLVECYQWCERGLASVAPEEAGGRTQMALQEALALSGMYTRGNNDDVRRFIEEGLKLAEAYGDRQQQMNLLAGLQMFQTRIGDFSGAVATAHRGIVVAQYLRAPNAVAMAEWMLGCAMHLTGDNAGALSHCELGFARAAASDPAELDFFGYDHRVRALIVLARALWLVGFPDRAAKAAEQAMDEALSRDHPVNLCIAMIYTGTVLLWRGDLDDAAQRLERLIAYAARHGLAPYHAVGQAMMGELAIARGDARDGVQRLRQALAILQGERHNVLTIAFHRALAEGLILIEAPDEARAIIDAALIRAQAQGTTPDVPELFRVQGEAWLRAARPDAEAAEQAFLQALQHAKAQSALSLELRSGMALARLWSQQDRGAEARDLLAGILDRFQEGHQTPDLKRAAGLLATLTHQAGAVTPFNTV